MLAEGKTADQIKQYFVQQYGVRVLAEPPQTGLNWLIYMGGLHQFMFDEENLVDRLEEAGLQDVKIRGFDEVFGFY